MHSNKQSLDQFEIITYESGIKTIRSVNHGETFHPKTGPLAEAEILYVKQQKLIERCSTLKKFIIWDVGLGGAANAIAAIQCLQNCNTEIEIHSFDKTTAPIQFALKHSVELGYLAKYDSELHKLIRTGQVKIAPHLQWKFHLGDFKESIKNQNIPSPHAIFYDPYSSKENPDLWTLEHFSTLHKRLDPNTPCLLTNYTRSTAVRVSLLLAGFFVGQGCAVGEKAESTIASNQLDLMDHPLEQRWLERVRKSTHSAPLRSIQNLSTEITPEDLQLLKSCPQFSAPIRQGI